MELRGIADLERHAQQRAFRHADRMHHPEELGVGAYEDVLAVVERRALADDAARAAAGDGAGFEYRNRDAALSQRDGGRHAGVAGTNDGYAAIHVRHAIQNLRSGVSEVRCVRTWKPPRWISSSSVR